MILNIILNCYLESVSIHMCEIIWKFWVQCLYNVWHARNWASVIISLEAYVSSVQGGSLCKHHKMLEKNRSLDPLEFQVCIIFKRSFLANCFCFQWTFWTWEWNHDVTETSSDVIAVVFLFCLFLLAYDCIANWTR